MMRIGFVVLMTASQALACPMCNTETGKQVREGIFGADFYTNVLMILAPFPLVLALCALAYWMIPHAKTRNAFGESEGTSR